MASIQNRVLADVTNQNPGYTTKAYISLISSFLVIAAAETADGDQFKVTDAHTFTAPAGFFEVYSLPKQTEATSDSTGETGGTMQVWKHKLFFPGDGPEVLALLETLKNKELMVIVEDANEPSGPKIQYGSEKMPCRFDAAPKFQSGNQLEGTKGYVVEIVSTNKFFYEGVITVAA